MTDIELYKDTLGHPDVLNTAHKLATQISDTDFVPKAFRRKPEAVMAALLTGRELGLGPMTALQRIHVIEGKAGLDAQGMRAQVLAAGHDLWIVESTPEKCVAAGRRRGSEHVQEVTWTMQEARAAGLAGKGNWKSYPRQMLQARATAELCRLIAPDALGGLAYSSEELADETPQTVRRANRQSPSEPQADVVRITTPATIPDAAPNTPAPAWDDDVTEAEIVEEQPTRRGVNHDWSKPVSGGDQEHTETGDPNLATTQQVRMLSALFNGRGMDEDQIDALVLDASSSRTTSRKELTKQEASTLIDQLKGTT
jgi:hypothetical protein